MREWKEARVHNKWSKKWDASLIRPKVKRCAYIIIAFIGKDRVMRNIREMGMRGRMESWKESNWEQRKMKRNEKNGDYG